MFDLCVIGAGWAGFNAAIRAAELGAKVCLIEQDVIGGVCLNKGCIPTKAMVNATKLFSHLKNFDSFGLEVKNYSLDLEKVQEYKTAVIGKLKAGIEFQIKNKKIEIIKAKARFISAEEIDTGTQKIKAKNFIVATGSRPTELPNLKFDTNKIISSNEILEIKSAPKTLLIVGGGVIGCEFANIFLALGTEITIVELLDRLLPQEDKDISQKIEMVFKRAGIKVLTKTSVDSCNLNDFEKVLICVGRTPNTQDLGLEEIGIKKERNRICVNDFLQTNIPNIYAAGDCLGRIMLAHVASYEAVVAAENIFGKKQRPVNYSAVPNCIFSDPEIGSVGLTEEEAKKQGINVKTSKFSFLGNGMAHILGDTDGFVKLVADSDTHQLLGAGIVGAKASELIAVLALSISNKLTIEAIHDTIFAHPTLSESIFEAARGFQFS